MAAMVTKQNKESVSGLRGTSWRDQLAEAYTKSKPLVASVGNDKFEIVVMGNDCCLLKNRNLMYSASGTSSAYVLARFFILAKESMVEMLGSVGRRVIDRRVLESLLRDATETNLVAGKDAEKLKDVISTVFWSEEDKSQEKVPLLPDSKKD